MKPRNGFTEQVFFSTIRISVQSQSEENASIGTGFLFQIETPQKHSVILLVSNRHVFQDPNNSIVLNFNKRDPEDTESILLGETLTLHGSEFASVYVEHPSKSVDLACIIVSGIVNPEYGVYLKTISEDLLDYDMNKLHPGQEVWFVGYPENRFDVKNNLPILRRGYIASIPRVDFQGLSQLLIDAQVFPGSSGSPVFVTQNKKFRLLGVVTQTMVRNQKLEAVPAITNIGIQQILGLGIVLKAHLIRDLISAVNSKIG